MQPRSRLHQDNHRTRYKFNKTAEGTYNIHLASFLKWRESSPIYTNWENVRSIMHPTSQLEGGIKTLPSSPSLMDTSLDICSEDFHLSLFMKWRSISPICTIRAVTSSTRGRQSRSRKKQTENIFFNKIYKNFKWTKSSSQTSQTTRWYIHTNHWQGKNKSQEGVEQYVQGAAAQGSEGAREEGEHRTEWADS